MSRVRRLLRSLWRWMCAAVRLGVLACVAFVAITVLQVLTVRWVDPPATATMVQRVVERGLANKGVDWVAYEPVPLSEMGSIPRAAVASEDGHFWFHRGFDWSGICAAAKSNASGKRLRGGSTISQQVARNVFLVQHRSWVRKGLETWYTFWLELLVPKARILELYLNVAESGPHHFGFQAAARHWYGKPASALSRDQSSSLVALLPNPRERTPKGDLGAKKAAWVRQNEVAFPGDPGFDRAQARWAAADGPLSCW